MPDSDRSKDRTSMQADAISVKALERARECVRNHVPADEQDELMEMLGLDDNKLTKPHFQDTGELPQVIQHREYETYQAARVGYFDTRRR